jgi:hypothetical protein
MRSHDATMNGKQEDVVKLTDRPNDLESGFLQ